MPTAGTIRKYGREWRGYTPLDIELVCYRHNITPEFGGLGAAGHFKEIVGMLWGEHNERKRFIWTPWAEQKAASAG